MATSASRALARGSAQTGRSAYSTVPIGSVAYSSMGTNTTPVAGTIYWAELQVARNITISNIYILNGGTVGTDKGIAAIYDVNGILLTNSALAGATTSGANTFQAYAPATSTGTYDLVGPARYFVAYQTNGTTDRFRTIATATFIDVLTTSATGAFGTLTGLTPPTTFTADKGPIAYVA